MKASTKMTLFTLAAMCLLAASPAMAARQLLGAQLPNLYCHGDLEALSNRHLVLG